MDIKNIEQTYFIHYNCPQFIGSVYLTVDKVIEIFMTFESLMIFSP